MKPGRRTSRPLGRISYGGKIKHLVPREAVASFALAMLTYLLYLSYSQVFFGKYFFIAGDGLSISLTSLREFYASLLSGESLYFSWSNYLGMNTSALYAYQAQLFSITSPLYLIFQNCDYAVLTAIAILIKVGLAAFFFTLLVRQVMRTPELWAVVFGVFYANSAFQQQMNLFAYIWMDAYFMVPLLCLLLYRFCKYGEWKLLPVAYAYLFLTNFYMGYMVGFFTLLILAVYLMTREGFAWKGFMKQMLLFGGAVIIGALVSAFALLPAFLFIMENQAPDSETAVNLYANVLDFINQLFIGADDMKMPYIYCGLPTVILFLSFCRNKKILLRNKLAVLIPLGILTLSCFVKPLYLFWHCGDGPDGFYYRFAFLISFLLCLAASYESLSFFREFSVKRNAVVCSSCLVFYLLMLAVQPYLSDADVNQLKYFLLNLLFLAGTTALQFCFARYGEDQKYRSAVLLSILMLTSAECIVNGYALFYATEDSEPYNYNDTFFAWNSSMDEILEEWGEDADFFRVLDVNTLNNNGDSYFGYKGISDFGSFEKYQVRNALSNLGIWTSARLILPYGATDFTETLLAVKYDLESVPYDVEELPEGTQASFTETGNYIGLGFLVDRDTLDFSFETDNAFENINCLASAMAGEELELYETVPESAVSFEENGITVDTESRTLTRESDEVSKLNYFVPADERQAYVQFTTDQLSSYKATSPILAAGYENLYEFHGRLSSSYIKQLALKDDGIYYGMIVMTEETEQETTYKSINPAYYNEDEFRKFYDIVAQNEKLEISDYGEGWITASLTVPDDSYVLYTSIPYDEGWTVTANGEEVTPVALLDGAFIGLDLPAGEYELEFTYTAPGAKAGIIVTCVGVSVYAAAVVISALGRKRKKKDL